jgi:hypothetical protein
MDHIQEHYRLYLVWDSVRYDQDHIASFTGAWFEGPVVQHAAQIQPNDNIRLDFTQDNLTTGLFLPDSFFVAVLRWKEVRYQDGRVTLCAATLDHNIAGTLRNLQQVERFVIDCSAHEEYQHIKTLVYPAWVVTKGT